MQGLELLLLLASLGHAHVLRKPLVEVEIPPEERGLGYDAKVVKIDVDAPDHYEDFFKFVTRPDIDAPRWRIKKINESAMAPGYWFLGPYQAPVQHERGGGWVGPHIYDQNGELIWSGVPMLDGFDAFDFKMSRVHGQDMLSFIYRHQEGVLLDSSYKQQRSFHIEDTGTLNMHDFNIVEGGNSALMLKTITHKAPQKVLDTAIAAGNDYLRDGCRVRFYGLEEVDAITGKRLFRWSSEGRVGLEETIFEKGPGRECHTNDGLDYIHANAVDKFPDGDYLLSGRHCNTIYKISAKDGSIVWRFGGKQSDFKWDDVFSGQHDARVRGQNATHTLISFLDNAEVPSAKPRYTHDFSRGFLIALRTDVTPMRAETVARFDHPHGEYAPGRGSYQVLPNGNTLIGWTTKALQTEYDTEGNLIMEASLRADLKSYRSYKFEWVGHPTDPPDVYSVAVSTPDNRTLTTSVHVSWNGATEVAKWNFYHTKSDGSEERLIASAPREGFETGIAYPGYASHVIVEAVDRNGNTLGRSDVVKSVPPPNLDANAVLEEEEWLQGIRAYTTAMLNRVTDAFASPWVAFAVGMICSAFACFLGFFCWRYRGAAKSSSSRSSGAKWRLWAPRYQRIGEKDETDETLVGEMDPEEESELKKISLEDRERGSSSQDTAV